MVKPALDYVCQSCGAASAKWQGKCPACGAWNSLLQEAGAPSLGGPAGLKAKRRAKPAAIESLSAKEAPLKRVVSGIGELDRAAGGGFAQGSAILLSGEPGIGKSTLLLQAAAAIAAQGQTALYFSGEEATGQIRMRAGRSASRRRRSGLPRKPASSAFSPPWSKRLHPISSLSIRFKRCGPRPSNRRRAR